MKMPIQIPEYLCRAIPLLASPSMPEVPVNIVFTAVISRVLSFIATLYPSWRAARVNPAEALRYE